LPIRISTERGGGSSSVLRKQLADSSLRSSASSRMTTLPRPRAVFREKRWHRSRMTSMGNSRASSGRPMQKKSGCVPASTWTQEGHTSQASSTGDAGRSHRSVLASSVAKSFLPTPCGPVKRQAWARRPRWMTRWKARMRASCPRTRCQDTRYLLANECLHDIRCRAGIEDLDSVGPSPGLDEEALAHALMVGVLATFEAIGRAIAAGAGLFQGQVEHEGEVRFQPSRGQVTGVTELVRIEAARVTLVDDR